MPAAADNPDGFWENLRFVKLNDEILNALGAAWDLPPRSESSFDSDTLAPQRAKAHLLLNSFADHHKWGWKDPRNCLTLPFGRVSSQRSKPFSLFATRSRSPTR